MPNETPKETPSRSSWTWFGIWSLVILVVYVLSPAPVFLIISKSGKNPEPVVTTVYAPLIALYDHVAAVRAFYDWYFGLWGLHG